MNKYNHYQRIICIGDESRYMFLNSKLPQNLKSQITYEELHNNQIFILYGDRCYIDKYPEENIIEIKLDNIPFVKLIHFPLDCYDIEQENICIDKLIVFTSFPYAKRDIIDDFEYIKDKFEVYDSEAILYKENRRFSSTDLSSEENAIEIAREEYSKLNLNSVIYNPDEDYSGIFEVSIDLVSTLKNSFLNKCLDCRERFQLRFETEYDFYVKSYFNMFSILDPDEYERFNRIFSFERIEKSKDIWKSYIYNFEKDYISGNFGLLDTINDLYKKFIKDICVNDLQYELKYLDKYILKQYNDYFGSEKILESPDNELDYIYLINKGDGNSIDLKFKNKLKDFSEYKLKIVLYEYIDKYIKTIGEKVEEGNNEK
ncbi:hypothetical protein [Clostridium butyricum]|uniref:hypothetical protein n=1 Tax=Clostridium butyricum TaxID=1492 RepID=UPI00374FA015